MDTEALEWKIGRFAVKLLSLKSLQAGEWVNGRNYIFSRGHKLMPAIGFINKKINHSDDWLGQETPNLWTHAYQPPLFS